MVNKRNTILFISLFVLIGLVLGAFFRKVDFAYIKDKYEDESKQIESSSNLNSEVSDQNSYNVTFTANDFRSIYFQGDSVTRDGITISGDNFANPSSLGFGIDNDQIATTLSITHDNSWRSINSVSVDAFVPINNVGFVKTLVDTSVNDVFVSWTIDINIDDKDSETTIDLDSGNINVFDKSINSLTYVAPLHNVFELIAPNDETINVKPGIISRLEGTSQNTYSIHGLEIAPALNLIENENKQLPMFVYYASVNGNNETLNGNGLIFQKQVLNFVNEKINSSKVINTSSDVETIEAMATQLLGLDVDIYNAYDIPMSDDQILFDEIKGGLDNESTDIKLLLSGKHQSYYLPINLEMSAFFIGSPREIECCDPKDEELNEAKATASTMLTTWLNDPLNPDVKTFSYVMYYGMSPKITNHLFDDSSDTACDKTGCDEWVRYETLATIEDQPSGGSGDEGACNTDSDDLKPGGDRWAHYIPDAYPMYPMESIEPGLTYGEWLGGWTPSTGDYDQPIVSKQSLLNSLSSLNTISKTIPSSRRAVPECSANTFIPVVVYDSIAYPDFGGTNQPAFACHSFDGCQTLIFEQTEPGETGSIKIQYPDIDQVSDSFSISFSYTYNSVNNIATYSTINEATTSIDNEITRLLQLGEAGPEGEGLRPGSTYADIANIIWSQIETFGWNNIGTARVNPENVDIIFYTAADGANEIDPTTALHYGPTESNTIYYSFRTKDTNLVTMPGTVETLSPFIIKDTTTNDYSPSASEYAAGNSCINSLVNSKFPLWGPSTTMSTIKQAINNDEQFNCVDKFGLTDIESSIELKFYKDAAGYNAYSDNDAIGNVTSQNPKKVYYRYEAVEELNWWESFSMTTQYFVLTPDNQSIYEPGHEQDVINSIQNELKSVAEINQSLTYAQIKIVVEKNAMDLVINQAADNIGVNYYNQNGVVQTNLDPNKYLADGSLFKFDIFLATPVPGYTYWNEMPKLDISVDWDSTYTVYANTTAASKEMLSYVQTESITTVDGETMMVASDGWTYEDLAETLPMAFDSLFEEKDYKYINRNSFSFTDNGKPHLQTEMLGAGKHTIEYEYDLSGNNCSWYDTALTCHAIDGVNLQGFDGVSNTFTFEVYEVVVMDPVVVARANAEIATQIEYEIDLNNDGKVDENTTVTYYKIVNIMKTVLEEEDAFVSSTNQFELEVRAVFNNSIGRPEFFFITDSNIGSIVSPQVTGFQYRIIDASQTKGLWFTDPSGYDYFTTWTGYNYHPPVAEGKIFGNGVMFWLIIVAFMALVAAGIGVGTVFIRKRKEEIARLEEVGHVSTATKIWYEPGSSDQEIIKVKKVKIKKVKKAKKSDELNESNKPPSNNIFLS